MELPLDGGKVIGLAGVRRCGKTFHFFEAMKRLLAAGVKRRQIIYLNFEDDRLQPLDATELDLVLRCHRELHPGAQHDKTHVFLDEVQNVPGWERWARRLHDTENVALFVTGSSSSLLKRDLATALRGRSITFDIFPLSFSEFLEFRGIDWVPHLADSESEVRSALIEYLRWGGFPEVVQAEEAMKPLILGEYATLMLFRDVVERYSVRNEPLMSDLLRHAFRNTATLLNVSKLHRDFSSRGVVFSKNTLFEYLDHLADSFLVFLLPMRDRSLRRQAHNPKKLHVIDPGLIAAFDGRPERDQGRKLETAVFLQLRRWRQSWFYHAGCSETDLCSEDGSAFWNVCWDLGDPATLDREKAAMAHAAETFASGHGRLLYHESGPLEKSLRHLAVPAWRWLLEQPDKQLGGL